MKHLYVTFLLVQALGFVNAQAPVGIYQFKGNANDLSGNGNHGVLENYNGSGTNDTYPVLTEGMDGEVNSAYFYEIGTGNGVGRISLGQPSVLDFDSSSFSISTWFKFDGTITTPTIVTNASGAHAKGFLISLYNNGGNYRPRLYIGAKEDFAWTKEVDIILDTVIQFGEWYHLTFVIDQENKLIKGYVCGEQRQISKISTSLTTVVGKDLDISNTPVLASHSTNLQFAMTANFPSTAWNGSIDDTYFFNRAIGEQEIADLCDGVVPGFNNLNKIEEIQSIIYPNPTKDFIHVSNKKVESILLIKSAEGKTLMSSNENTINIKHLPEGIYFVEFKQVDGKTKLYKIVKTN
jgi:hypothetical protein